jgi:putative transposase
MNIKKVNMLPRKKREWYPGAVFHITNRGNHRNDIFRDGEDYLVYLTILKESLEKYKSILYCYCLMTNHVHLIIKTTDIEIGEASGSILYPQRYLTPGNVWK